MKIDFNIKEAKSIIGVFDGNCNWNAGYQRNQGVSHDGSGRGYRGGYLGGNRGGFRRGSKATEEEIEVMYKDIDEVDTMPTTLTKATARRRNHSKA